LFLSVIKKIISLGWGYYYYYYYYYLSGTSCESMHKQTHTHIHTHALLSGGSFCPPVERSPISCQVFWPEDYLPFWIDQRIPDTARER
jgi:hypothetical protein